MVDDFSPLTGSARAAYENVDDTIFSLSEMFQPSMSHTSTTPNMILVSSDNTIFHVHSDRLLPKSINAFNSTFLPSSNEEDKHLLVLPESSAILDLVLRIIYELPFAECLCSDEDMFQTLHALVKYGYSPQAFASAGMPLYNMILCRSHTSPLDMYAICMYYQLKDLYSPIASNLLSCDLLAMTDEQAERIGAINLRRLISLHVDRTNTLKTLLSSVTPNHEPSPDCGITEQNSLKRVWSLGTKALAWDVRPDLSPAAIENALASLAECLSCPDCKECVITAAKDLANAWASVRTTL